MGTGCVGLWITCAKWLPFRAENEAAAETEVEVRKRHRLTHAYPSTARFLTRHLSHLNWYRGRILCGSSHPQLHGGRWKPCTLLPSADLRMRSVDESVGSACRRTVPLRCATRERAYKGRDRWMPQDSRRKGLQKRHCASGSSDCSGGNYSLQNYCLPASWMDNCMVRFQDSA
jgi:hypothetical protein